MGAEKQGVGKRKLRRPVPLVVTFRVERVSQNGEHFTVHQCNQTEAKSVAVAALASGVRVLVFGSEKETQRIYNTLLRADRTAR